MSMRKLVADVAAVREAVEDPAKLLPEDAIPTDPLLAAMAAAHVRRLQAEEEIRLLVAYARRFVYPHPYTLGELSAAAGMSVSGIRTAYNSQDVDKVSEATGMTPVAMEGEDS